jgi:hypothetical protein
MPKFTKRRVVERVLGGNTNAGKITDIFLFPKSVRRLSNSSYNGEFVSNGKSLENTKDVPFRKKTPRK